MRYLNRSAALPVCLILCCAALTACGARPSPQIAPPPAPVEVELEPVLVEADETGQIKTFDASSLFQDGQNAFESQKWEACEQAFERLLVKFPNSRYTHPTLYNRGLCLEALKLHTLAAQSFRRYAQIASDEKDKLDGLFRMGFNLVRGKKFADALMLYDRLLQHELLGTADKAECYLRRATAYIQMDRAGLAEKDLKTSMALIKEAYEGVIRGSELMAEAHFRRGEIYQRLSHGVRLKLPVARMKGDLRDKVRYFKQSQASYIDSVNVQNSYWATAAGLRLGELYEQFYRDVLAAQVPKNFDKETRRFYIVQLKKELQPLLEQSLAIYEKNITMSERIGASNEWVSETEERVTRLRSLIEANAKAVDRLEKAGPRKASKPPRRGS